MAGCAILEAILDLWPAHKLGVADRGIREGILRGLMRRDQERAEKIAAMQRLIDEAEESGVSSSSIDEILAAEGVDTLLHLGPLVETHARFPERTNVQLVREPELSIVVWERIGWSPEQYQAWSDMLIEKQIALVTPSSHQGRTNTRVALQRGRHGFGTH